MVQDFDARDALLATIQSAGHWLKRHTPENARWLAADEKGIGLRGCYQAHMMVFSPAGSPSGRHQHDVDMYLFYGSNGELIHEEPAQGAQASRGVAIY